MIITGDINTGGKCNLDCSFCKEKDLPYKSFEQIINEVDESLQYDENSITISGGEPLIRKDIFEILNYCMNKSNNVYVLSNLKAFKNKEFLEKFLSLDLQKLSIVTSLDSHEESLFNQLCNEDYFKNKIEIIDKLYNEKIKLTIGVVVTKLNIKKMMNWYNFVSKKWNVDIFLKLYSSLGASIEEINMFLPNYDEFNIILKDIHEKNKNNRRINTIYIPFCKVLGFEKHSIEYKMIKFLEMKKINPIVAREYFSNYVFTPKCEKCCWFSRCLGVDKNYIFMYGLNSIEGCINV